MVTRIDQGELLTVLYAEDEEPPFATFSNGCAAARARARRCWKRGCLTGTGRSDT